MLDNMSMQKRMILATVFSLLFFLFYAMLFPPEQVVQNSQTQTASAAPQMAQKTDTKVEQTPTAVVKNVEATLVNIKSADFTMKIDALGRISSKKLLGISYHADKPSGLEIVNQLKRPLPLEIRFSEATLNKEALNTAYTASISQATLTADKPVVVTLKQVLSSTTVTKTLTFYADGHYDIALALSNDKSYFIAPGMRPNVDAEGFTVHGILTENNKEILEIIEDGESNEQKVYYNVRLASAFDRYYATMFYSKKDDLNVVVSPSTDGEENPVLFIQGAKELNLNAYIGPKEYKVLKAIDPLLVDALEYGWFTFIAAPMFWLLQWLHALVGNWGFAIILVTILSRIALYPLSYKGMVSMQKLKAVAPEIKEIQKKHKGDPQKMNAATMALYKKHGANPLGGCLPLLLQIPIFFSIYRVLLNSIELQGADFMLWITDLSEMDPYFVLPVIMGVTMYYQQKITPTNFTDPMQEKIFKFLPLIFTLFFFTFPAGLVLYWAVNNVLTIAQQMIVNKKFAAIEKAKHGTTEKKS